MLGTTRASTISGIMVTPEPQIRVESPEVRVLKALEPLTHGNDPKISVATQEEVSLRFNHNSKPEHVEYIEMVASLSAVLNRAEMNHYLKVPLETCREKAEEIHEGLTLKQVLWQMANRTETPIAQGAGRLGAVIPDSFPGIGLWGAIRNLAETVSPKRFTIDIPQFEPVASIAARME